MLIDSVYKTAQGELNKEQLGYLKPLYYNLFINKAIRKVYNKIFVDHKSSVRRKNWMLDGKQLANVSEHNQQLIEYYSTIFPITEPLSEGVFTIPTDSEFIENVSYLGKMAEKVSYSDMLDLKNNIYSPPTDYTRFCSKVGNTIIILPATQAIDLHYIRKPKIAKWTFEEVNDKPMFDGTADDFQDIDMPETFKDELISLVVESASKSLREYPMVQAENTDQQQDLSAEQIQ